MVSIFIPIFGDGLMSPCLSMRSRKVEVDLKKKYGMILTFILWPHRLACLSREAGVQCRNAAERSRGEDVNKEKNFGPIV
ncbi:MAG: hypothetical protein HQL24_04155 [Candidatus Omnitrophica bacterium]|nr:hypothetical protein [Candidatus Omnitrophota bacterium]